jgi:hypothetical protein
MDELERLLAERSAAQARDEAARREAALQTKELVNGFISKMRANSIPPIPLFKSEWEEIDEGRRTRAFLRPQRPRIVKHTYHVVAEGWPVGSRTEGYAQGSWISGDPNGMLQEPAITTSGTTFNFIWQTFTDPQPQPRSTDVYVDLHEPHPRMFRKPGPNHSDLLMFADVLSGKEDKEPNIWPQDIVDAVFHYLDKPPPPR